MEQNTKRTFKHSTSSSSTSSVSCGVMFAKNTLSIEQLKLLDISEKYESHKIIVLGLIQV